MNFKKMNITCSTGEVVTGYDAYLSSNHWKTLRLEIIKERGSACERCFDVTSSPNVHHKTYKRLGNEKKTDLTLLCQKCHKTIHNKRKEARDQSLAHVKKVVLSLKPEELKELYKYIGEIIN